MNAHDQKAALFCVSAAYYGRPIPDAVADMYAADVADLSVAEVKDALNQLRRDPKRRFPPLPAEVVEYACPQAFEDAPEQIAARIGKALSDYGWNNHVRARAFVGEIGWRTVQDMGGWADLCRRTNAVSMGVFTAQVRDLARANASRPPRAARAALPPSAVQGRLEALTGNIGNL